MQSDVVDVEGNLIAAGKSKGKAENYDKKKHIEDGSAEASTSSNTQDQKIDEINNIFKAFANKMGRLEVGKKAVTPVPQNAGQRN